MAKEIVSNQGKSGNVVVPTTPSGSSSTGQPVTVAKTVTGQIASVHGTISGTTTTIDNLA